MKKFVNAVFAATLLSGFVFAGGVENKSNLNGGFLRNPSRNTETERPEAAFYNIAGTAFMKDGFFLEAGNQFVIKEYANELKTNNAYAGYGVKDYKSSDDGSVYLYPDFDAVYKKDKFALFGTFGVYAGGGHLSYEKGTTATSLLFLNGANSNKEIATKAYLASLGANGAAAQYKQGIIDAVAATGAVPAGSEWTTVETVMGMSDAQIAAVPTYATLKSAVSESYTNYLTYTKLASDYNSEYTKYATLASGSAAMAGAHKLDVTSMTLGGQIGMAYRHVDWLSLSGAYRYTYGTQHMTIKYTGANAAFKAANGRDDISYDAHGWGQSIVFGVHAKPPVLEGLDVSMQYQTLSRIEYDVENVKGEIAKYYDISEKKHFRTDLPAVLNIGLGYRVIDPLYMSLSFNYYFNDIAHQDNILAETDYDNSWEVAYGVDVKLCKYAGASCGIQYSRQGVNDTSNSAFNPVLDSIVIGGGIEILPVEDLTLTLSCLKATYFDTDYYLGGKKSAATKTTLSKDATTFGVGVTYHFPVK